MKTPILLASLLAILPSILYAAPFECQSQALQAARAIHEINFPGLDTSSVTLADVSQRSNSAEIIVTIGSEGAHGYNVKLEKNRGASMSLGGSLTTSVSCSVSSIVAE